MSAAGPFAGFAAGLLSTMSEFDPFNILGSEPEVPPSFDEAVREAVSKLQASAERFEPLYQGVPEEWFTDEEWKVVEGAAEELVKSVERAEDAYVAVMYDSHAWYRILENLEQVHLRLESAIGVMERVQERHTDSQSTDRQQAGSQHSADGKSSNGRASH